MSWKAYTDSHVGTQLIIRIDPDYNVLPDELSTLSAECRDYLSISGLDKAPNYYYLWTDDSQDKTLHEVNTKLETLIDQLGNTTSYKILAALNIYPILSLTAHRRPFSNHWLNLGCGIIFPVGLFFYFRIWMFGLRLKKDIEVVIDNNSRVTQLIAEVVEEQHPKEPEVVKEEVPRKGSDHLDTPKEYGFN